MWSEEVLIWQTDVSQCHQNMTTGEREGVVERQTEVSSLLMSASCW